MASKINSPPGAKETTKSRLGTEGSKPQLGTKIKELVTCASYLPPLEDKATKPFVVLKSKNQTKKLSSLSVFTIHRDYTKHLGSEVKCVAKLGSGDILFHCKTQSQAAALKTMATLGGIPCEAEPHRSLNQSKGVIRSRDLLNTPEEEITAGIDGVLHSRRMKVFRNGKLNDTNSILLTFDSCIPPTQVKAGYLKLDVLPYIPNPMRCFKCQKFGHTKSRCRHKEVCANCGKVGYSHKE